MKDTLVVNLFGGPGAGKSTTAAHIFAELKWRGVSCEFVPEYVKQKVYSESTSTLEDQLYVFANHVRRIRVCEGKVDVVIQDASILNSLIYHSEDTSELFKDLVVEEYFGFQNANILIERNKPYYPEGRLQTEKEAKEIDRRIESLLSEELELDYASILGGPRQIPEILQYVAERSSVGDSWPQLDCSAVESPIVQ